MRKALLLIFILFVASVFFIGNYFRSGGVSPVTSPPITTPTTFQKISVEKSSLFVPYWTVSSDLPVLYDRFIYFGITPTLQGVNREEAGYLTLKKFTSNVPRGKKKILTLRMLDNTQNFAILKDPKIQQKVISETISITKNNDFDGVLLDLELKALPFDSLLKQINNFTSDFYRDTKAENLTFSITQYGDTFYRVRPFDVETVAKNSDEVMIMAYDFHKAGGEPGPNFPLDGRNTYGYDFKEMIDGFLKAVPPQKLTVIFGYFGYDWPTDEKGKAINTAASFSLLDIQKQYLQKCSTCEVVRDALSSENKITYLSDDHIHHTVWYEDQESIDKKEAFLQSKGITSYSYWANSYF